MGNSKAGNNINGWIIVDKPTGMTSTAVVNKIKRAFGARKAGHAGTLDPSATGVLAIALGEATKTIPYVTNREKSYIFEVKFGEATDTDDSEGKIIRRSKMRPSEQDILAAIPLFQGEIKQTPPLFSAVKINGERAYSLARRGEDFDIAPRSLLVSSLKLEKYISKSNAILALECGKGGYVRAIARDLGLKLGCYGHVKWLRRISSGSFNLSIARHSICRIRSRETENIFPTSSSVFDDPSANPYRNRNISRSRLSNTRIASSNLSRKWSCCINSI